MILIRGIKGESYARRIEEGIVDCRDVLSALLKPPVTGYEYSDYYEKNLVKALSYCADKSLINLNDPEFLYSLLVDYYVPHIYLTYFHVLNEKSLMWLDKFDDDYKFVAMNVKIDRITKTAIGREYFGAKMQYVDSICELKQDTYNNFYAACMCSIEDLFTNKKDMTFSLRIYNTLFFPLLCREQDEKFTDIENEFRIIAYDCPRIKNGIMSQISREALITGNTGIKYRGVLDASKNTVFESNSHVLRNPCKSLEDIIYDEQGKISLDSKFKPININGISDKYWYVGNKKDCANFIQKMLANMPGDIYVNRTRRKLYKLSELKNVKFVPGYQKIEY